MMLWVVQNDLLGGYGSILDGCQGVAKVQLLRCIERLLEYY